MRTDSLDPKLRTVRELFDDSGSIYTVPVYQRNYAWQAEQIEQLLNDVQDAIDNDEESYFLGNLIVSKRGTTRPDYEVIDGQQRLTTLYLLLTFLARTNDSPHPQDKAHDRRLRYESRPRASETLRRIDAGAPQAPTAPAPESNEDAGIQRGFNIIQQFMDQEIDGAKRKRFERFLRDRVTVVLASLPDSTDLNRYFEIMNTRGQQLQQVDIVKARLMSYLPDETERACFAWVWDACADMDSYVQRPLTRGNTALRGKLFGDDWTWLAVSDYSDLLGIFESEPIGTDPLSSLPSRGSAMMLDEALSTYASALPAASVEEVESDQFKSTIAFPALLLHVLKVMNDDENEEEGQLDDKRLIRRFVDEFADREADRVRGFIFTLLQSRNLFDGFILKREFSARSGEDGEWSMRRIIKRKSKGRAVSGHVATFSKVSTNLDEDYRDDSALGDLLLVQSMLRVTYTSPRTMHWITKMLKYLVSRDPKHVLELELAELLQNYARTKVKEAYFDPDEVTGFNIGRIVFTYLDYLIFRQGLMPSHASEFKFSFRTSIEHFYPQHPDEQQSGNRVTDECLNLLGNLALVSVGANSKFSNSLPMSKATNYRNTIELQSPKLSMMAEIARRAQNWGDAQVEQHHDQMVTLLRQDLRI